jgi:NADP-reducing hydrogenase subunit HndB
MEVRSVKTIEDLKRMREKFHEQTKIRDAGGVQIIIGMGTCGIAAGAREVMSAIFDEIAKRKLQDVTVRQTGCIGMCEKEVLVDVVRPGEPRITYGKVTPATVSKIISEHVVNGRIVEDLVVGKIADQ